MPASPLHQDPHADAPDAADAADAVDAPAAVEDVLIEDVSIDGMCGVY
jgi:mycofactocin precursor